MWSRECLRHFQVVLSVKTNTITILYFRCILYLRIIVLVIFAFLWMLFHLVVFIHYSIYKGPNYTYNFLKVDIVIFAPLFHFISLSKYILVLLLTFYFILRKLTIQTLVVQMKAVLVLFIWLIIQSVMNQAESVPKLITWLVAQTFTDTIEAISFCSSQLLQ